MRKAYWPALPETRISHDAAGAAAIHVYVHSVLCPEGPEIHAWGYWESLTVGMAFYPNDLARALRSNFNIQRQGRSEGETRSCSGASPSQGPPGLRPLDDRRFLAGGRRSRYGAGVLTYRANKLP